MVAACSAIALWGCSSNDPDPVSNLPGGPTPTEFNVQCQLIEDGFGPAGTESVALETIATGLQIPWAIDWLPGGDMLVTERDGTILKIEPGGTKSNLAQVPLGAAAGEGGLLGLAIHPDVATNNYFYIYLTAQDGAAIVNRVERWLLSGDRTSATRDRIIVDGIPALQYHNGGRLRFGPDGYLYIGTGDAGRADVSQDVNSLAGKILRVTEDGAAAPGNPFPGSATWIYGIRNTQGFDWRADGRMLVTDHGPSGLGYENGRSGHDELSVASAGDSLGWPTDYACERTGSANVASMTWRDSMPPGGAAVYTGQNIPAWQGDVFIGVLGFGGEIGHLHRVRVADDGNVLLSETYFLDAGLGRVRDVAMGPDGHLYLTTSRCDGRATCGVGDAIYRVVPGI